jgi:hypothetical protein
MSRIERINSRLPRLYQAYEKKSLFFILFQSIDKQLNDLEEGIIDLMKAHWVDTAKGEDLDKLSALVGAKRITRDDALFRRNLKRTVEEYRGGGTLPIIKERVRELLNSINEDDFEIIENPRVKTSAEFLVVANDTWSLGSNSITDEKPTLSLTIEGKGVVNNPQITNLDTGQSITLDAKLTAGKQLVIKQNKALLGEEEITEKIKSEQPLQLLRKGSVWRYTESLSERIGVFDTGKFDEHTFAIGIPTVKVRFEWVKSQPSTFLVKIKSDVLRNSGLNKLHIKKILDAIRALGVKSIITVME